MLFEHSASVFSLFLQNYFREMVMNDMWHGDIMQIEKNFVAWSIAA